MTNPRIHVLVATINGNLVLLDSHTVTPHVPVVIGREGDIGIGIEPVDPKVSRHALTITSAGDVWHVEVTNRNGADLLLWGQPSMPCRPVETASWPRIALRVKGSPQFRHWVLLDDPSLGVSGKQSRPPNQLTESVEPPPPLTQAQQVAIRTLFGNLLAWPPRIPATPMQLKQVARRLQIGREAVQRRLEEARRRALALGLGRVVPLTDPEYLYVLVRAGYLSPSPSHEDLDSVLR